MSWPTRLLFFARARVNLIRSVLNTIENSNLLLLRRTHDRSDYLVFRSWFRYSNVLRPLRDFLRNFARLN